jgi:hypothetical protein
MRNRANRLGMAETANEPPVEQFEDTALGLHRGMRGLIAVDAFGGCRSGRGDCD